MPFLTESFHRSIMTVPDHTEPPEAPSPGFRGNPVEPDFSDRLGPGRRDNAGKALTTSREASGELSLSSSWMEDHRRTQARKARNYLLSSVMTLESVTNVAYTVCLWDISRQSWVGAKWAPNHHPNCDPRGLTSSKARLRKKEWFLEQLILKIHRRYGVACYLRFWNPFQQKWVQMTHVPESHPILDWERILATMEVFTYSSVKGNQRKDKRRVERVTTL
ncbi:hypothetical protein BKA56DRAFT_598755 [Ilyonectria sp. MPI-CAGE-AT-0026]|nr:hypothetical protein BKA56DRAFT_598755 [Ilyonectria sp. MPI-CAGE-AT-0026]